MPIYTATKKSPSSRIKTDFVSGVLRNSAEDIREEQKKVADDWNLIESGKLRSWLQGHFSVANQEGGGKLSMRYLTYARFLDIPDERRAQRRMKREGYHLYNRLVFGILYRRTLPTIRYGLTDDIRKMIGSELVQAVGGDRNRAALIAKSLRKGYN